MMSTVGTQTDEPLKQSSHDNGSASSSKEEKKNSKRSIADEFKDLKKRFEEEIKSKY